MKLCISLSLTAAFALAQAQQYDLVIAGGEIIDGTGNPAIRADVGIRGDKIVAVGILDGASAKRTIDARGKTIVPGFIDIHSHADDRNGDRRGLRDSNAKRRAAPSLITQGITTVVCNPDGSSPTSIRDQREALKKLGIGPNAILLTGFNTIRGQAMGSDYKRPARPDEIQKMRALVKQGMEDGAWGLSAGLEYVPAIWSTTGEVVEAVKEIVPYQGFYSEHERSSGDAPMWWKPSQDPAAKPNVLDSMWEVIEIGERSGARVVATHLKSRGLRYWGGSRILIEMVNRARARGVDVWGDVYPYDTSGSDGGLVLIPRWALGLPEAGEGGGGAPIRKDLREALRETLKDPKKAEGVKLDISHELELRGGAENVLILDYPDKQLVGKTLDQIAKARKTTPVDAAIALQLEGYSNRPGGVRIRSFSMAEVDVDAFMAQPWVASSTDAGIALPEDGPAVHPRYYGSYPRKIRRYAMEHKALTVESAIRASTSLPAQIVRLQDRGLIREGFYADLAVLDLATIRDRSTPENPHQYSEGVDYVFVNGQAVVEKNNPTWALPGRVLDRPK
jgi:N-acyl-D-amino-acid deacylase